MPPAESHRRLSTPDAAFLYVEKPNQPMHLGSVNVYDGRVSREEVIEVLRGRMHLLPRYRQRVVFPPLGIAHPTWEDDPDFAVERHVEEVTLPPPGDDRVLSEVGGRAFGRVLGRDRPLWKLVLLQGHESGHTAMIAIVHHALVDGVAGVELQTVMHDLTPQASQPPQPQVWKPRPLPDALSLLRDAVSDRMAEVDRTFMDESRRHARDGELSRRLQRLNTALAPSMAFLLQPALPMPFNGPLSNVRQFAWHQCSFAEIRAIRSVFGGTVNDAVLCILAGAFRRYLLAHGVPVDGVELRAMCPVIIRSIAPQGDADASETPDNVLSMMFAPLFVGIAAPGERLAAEREAMERLRLQDQAGGLYAVTELAQNVPPGLPALASQSDMLVNTVSTNVPGPQIPLYLAGRKLLGWYPLEPLVAGLGLVGAVLSYNQVLTFAFTVDPGLVPDVWFFADCLRNSYEELKEAARVAAAAASGA